MNCQDCMERLGARVDQALPENERRAVDEHLASCPACQREFQKTETLLGNLKGFYAGLPALHPPNPRFRFPPRPVPGAATGWNLLPSWLFPTWPKLAFGLALVLGLVGGWLHHAGPPVARESSPTSSGFFSVSTGGLELLGSGSEGPLEARYLARLDSRLSVPGWGTLEVASGTCLGFSPDEVTLDRGTMKCQVLPGNARHVTTPQVEVFVLGTIFTVRTQEGSTGIEVASGQVQVRWPGEAVPLNAGRSATMHQGTFREVVFPLPLWDARSQAGFPSHAPTGTLPPHVETPPATTSFPPSVPLPHVIDPATAPVVVEPDAGVTNPLEVFTNGQ